jgi:WD40 repeat protein
MWALKCFTRPAAGLRERYQQIDAHLREARLPFSVGFQFLPEGVRIRGLWFPALKMEWIEGLQLNQFVGQNAGKPEHLRAILGLWVRLCKRLRDSKIAHADLQHGNVLLVPGETVNRLKLRLIDYDGMWVPALADNPSGEAGHPAYQHPARLRDRVYSADVDRFTHLVIGCALRALAIAGRPLWDQFDNGDNLLFREVDLANPAASPLFRTLWDLDDPTVTNLLALLIVSTRRPIGDTPWLDEVLDGDKAVPVSDAVLARAADTLGVARRVARKAMPVAQIYAVPEEANQFVELGAWSRRKRRAGPSLAFLLSSAAALVAAVVVIIVLVTSGGKGTAPVDPAPVGPPAADKGPRPIVKTGIVETRWVAVVSDPPIVATKGLLSGIDVAPPNSPVVRRFPSLGPLLAAWPLADGLHALLVTKSELSLLDLDSSVVTSMTTLRGETVRAVISPDRRYVVLGGKDHNVRCFDIDKRAMKWSKKFPAAIGALATTSDGKRVAATAERAGYVEWLLEDGSEVRRHESLQASKLSFTPDGRHALAASEGGVELWSLDEARVTSLSPHAATAVAVSADGKHGIAGGADLKIWELPDGRPLPDRAAHVKNPVAMLTTSPDGTLLVGSDEGEVAVIGADETKFQVPLPLDPPGTVVSFGMTLDGSHALVVTERGSLALSRVAELVRPSGPAVGPTAGCLEFARSVNIAPDFRVFSVDAKGDRFLAASDSRVQIYDAVKFSLVDRFQLRDGRIVAAGFGPDDKFVVCQADDEQFRTRAWDPKKLDAGPLFKLAKGELGEVTRIVPVKDRPWVLVTTKATGDILFDPATGVVVEGWPSLKKDERRIATPSPDGRFIAIGSARDVVQLWSCDTTSFVRPCEGSTGVVALAYTPDGRKLVGLWHHGRVRMWTPETGKFIREVDHDYFGSYGDLSLITNDIAVLGTAPNRLLLSLESGKALGTGDGPDPLMGRGPVIPSRGLALATDRDSRLTAWRVESRHAAVKPPRLSSWPEASVLRDAPLSPPAGLAFSADGQSVIVATQDGKLSRYTADRLIYVGEVHADEVPIREMVPLRGDLYTLGRQAIVTVRDGNTLLSKGEIAPASSPKSVTSLFVVHPEETHFLAVADKLRVVDLKTKKEITFAAIPRAAIGKPLTQFAYSRDGSVGVARWGNEVTTIWHPKLVGPVKVLQELKTPVAASTHALVLSEDGKFAILGTADGKITIWETASGKEVFQKDVYPPAVAGDAVVEIAMIPKSMQFVTAGRDGRVILWDLDGLKQLKEYHGPEGAWRIAVAPDGRAVFMQQPELIQRINLTAAKE